jgi:hypothetical protein
MNTTKFDFEQLAKNWPAPIVARSEGGTFTGGCLSPRTLANLDSLGEGPPRVVVNGKVAYPVDTFIEWLKRREENRRKGNRG